jgi:hypothetical protein
MKSFKPKKKKEKHNLKKIATYFQLCYHNEDDKDANGSLLKN